MHTTPHQTHTAAEIVVFMVRRTARCSECDVQVDPGELLRLEDQRPLCLTCADLDHLVYLPRGDATLTRRARAHSGLEAVVVEWSRTRKRYERQGVLVEEAALKQAEDECLSDVEARLRRRQRDADRRDAADIAYVAAFGATIRTLFPGCPPQEADLIAAHACARHSGRIGRTAAAKEFAAEAVRLAVAAHVRHAHTQYDRLLGQYGDRGHAREQVRERVESILREWQSSPGVS